MVLIGVGDDCDVDLVGFVVLMDVVYEILKAASGSGEVDRRAASVRRKERSSKVLGEPFGRSRSALA